MPSTKHLLPPYCCLKAAVKITNSLEYRVLALLLTELELFKSYEVDSQKRNRLEIWRKLYLERRGGGQQRKHEQLSYTRVLRGTLGRTAPDPRN